MNSHNPFAMNLEENHKKLTAAINTLKITEDYTKELKERDLGRLSKIEPSNLLEEMKNFQEALFQILKQKGGLHDRIAFYVTEEGSRMRMLEDFFKQGLFDFIYKIFEDRDIGSLSNWNNLSPDYHTRCIPLAMEAGKKDLVNFLIRNEYDIHWGNSRSKDEFVNLITSMRQLSFLTDDDVNLLTQKISNNSLAKDDLINTIKWAPNSDNVITGVKGTLFDPALVGSLSKEVIPPESFKEEKQEEKRFDIRFHI